MAKSKFFTQFNHCNRVGITFEKPSLTQQSFGYECDINNIVRGCESSLAPNRIQPQFNTVYDVNSMQNALVSYADAKSNFELLPSNVREEFNNDPLKLVKFLDNPKNRDRAIELGLVKPKEDSVTQPVKGEVSSSFGDTSAQTSLDSIVPTDTPQTT